VTNGKELRCLHDDSNTEFDDRRQRSATADLPAHTWLEAFALNWATHAGYLACTVYQKTFITIRIQHTLSCTHPTSWWTLFLNSVRVPEKTLPPFSICRPAGHQRVHITSALYTALKECQYVSLCVGSAHRVRMDWKILSPQVLVVTWNRTSRISNVAGC
jgi:hypothetical protein